MGFRLGMEIVELLDMPDEASVGIDHEPLLLDKMEGRVGIHIVLPNEIDDNKSGTSAHPSCTMDQYIDSHLSHTFNEHDTLVEM